MLKKHLLAVLEQTTLSDVQRQQIFDLLLSIKEDASLLSEFNTSDAESLRESLHGEKKDKDNDTFMDLEINIYEDEVASTDQITYEGLEFNLIEEIVDLSTDSFDTTESSDDIGLADAATGAFPIPAEYEVVDKLGRYIDLGVLGQGGMGEVRKVHDGLLKRNLAMKIIHPSMLSSRTALSRFTEEAQVGAQLQHPNIIPIHEFGELSDGRLYFTMTQIKGKEFTDFIRGVHAASDEDNWNVSKHGTTFRQLIQIFHKICETMAYAHSVGVIHRDLKPENVMIGGFGEVLVVDWGIAKVYGAEERIDLDEEDVVHTGRSEQNHMATRMGIIAGTPAYMSPEQAEGRIDLLGPPSDIYTLGAILYEILSGRPPYNGTSALEIVEKVKTTPPPSLLTTNSRGETLNLPDVEPLEEHHGKVPLPLIEMCQRAMQRDIEDRYSTASEFANEIFNWFEGAQKRDKALNEYHVALSLLAQAEKLEQEYDQYWNTSNELIQENGFTNAKNWDPWEQANQTILQANRLRQEYRSAIQGVLIYDSELEEANEAMAALIATDIIHAVAFGEPRRRESLERELIKHLQHLPKQTQQRFLDQVEQQRNDDISLMRARRGTMVGRKSMRTQVINALNGSSRLISLIGTAGVGKSRLALEVIHDLQTTEDHTYFCDLTQANSEIGVALFVAKSMNIKLRNIDPIGQLGELFAKRKTILVLDNLEQVLTAAGKVISRWMKQASSLRIIATSRIKLRLESEVSFAIQPMSVLESMELFTKRGQQVKPSFTLQESTRQTVGRLVNQLDHLPLAIELAAARLNIFNVEEIEQRLMERFDLLRSRSKGTQPLHGALNWSWDLLTPWAKAVLSQTSVFRGGFEVTAAETVLNCGIWKEAPPVFDVLQDLCDDSLLIENRNADGEIRFGLLESIRQYANEQLLDQNSIGHQLSGPIPRIETQQRHAAHYAKYGQKSFLEKLDNSETKNQWGHFFEELENFIIGIEYGDGNIASNCCLAALKILSMKGPVSLGVDLAGSVLIRRDISERAKKQLSIAQIRFLRISGRMIEARGQSTQTQEKDNETVLPTPLRGDSTGIRAKGQGSRKESLEEYPNRQNEDLLIEADDLLERGNIEEAESSYTQALKLYNYALGIYTRLDSFKGIVETKLKIGAVYQRIGEYDSAQLNIEHALILSTEHDFILLNVDALCGMGEVHRLKGDFPSAVKYFKQSLSVAEDIGDRFREEKAIGLLALICQVLGQYDEAISYYERAIKIAHEVGNKSEVGSQLGNLGNVYKNLGQYDLALSHYQMATVISKEIGNKRSEGVFLGNCGNVYKNMGDYLKAIDHFRLSIQISTSIGHKRNIGIQLGNLGLVYQELGQFDEAIANYKQCITIAREIGNKKSLGIALGNLGSVYLRLNKTDDAISHYKQSIEISKEIGNTKSAGIQLGNLGELLSNMSQWTDAAKHLVEAIDTCKDVVPAAAGAFQGSLAWVYAKQGKIQAAKQLLDFGEPLVEVIPLEHGKFLCKKAKVLHLCQQPQEAADALKHAKAICEELHTNSDSELNKSISLAENFVLSSTPEIQTEDAKEDLELDADDLFERGNIEEAESLYDEAIEFYTQALDIYTQLKHLKGIVETKLKIGKVLRKQGDLEKASQFIIDCLSMSEDEALFLLCIDCYNEMGVVENIRGNLHTSLDYHKKALVMAREVGDKFREATNLMHGGLLYYELGDSEQAMKEYTQSLEISRELGDKRSECATLGNIGNLHKGMGNYTAALKHCTLALNIAREIGNKRNECAHLGDIANINQELGNLAEAIKFYHQSRQIAIEIGDKHREAIQLGNLGIIYSNLGEYDQAITFYEQSIKLAHETNNTFNEAIQIGNLGDLHSKIERWDEAEKYLKQAIEICSTILPPAQGAFLGSLAWVYSQQSNLPSAKKALDDGEALVKEIPLEYGKFLCKKAKVLHLCQQSQEAVDALKHAKAIYEDLHATSDSELGKSILGTEEFISSTVRVNLTDDEIEDLELDADDLLERGNIEEAESFYDEAMQLYTQALDIYTRIGKVSGIIKTNLMIGKVYTAQGEHVVAKQRYERCLELSKEHNLFLLQADSLNQLAGIQRILEEYSSALTNYQEALRIVRVSEDSFRESTILGSLGLLYEGLAEYSNAIGCFQQAIRISQQIGDKRAEGIHLGNLGTIYKKIGQYEQGAEIYIQAESIAREINDKRSLGIQLGNLGNLYYFLNRYEEAIGYLEQGMQIARGLGNKRSEAIHIGNLGIVLGAVERWEEAQRYLTESIALCKSVYPTAAGAFSAYLAVILAHQEKFEEAMQHINYGEELVQESSDLLSNFLCNKAKVFHLSRQPSKATESLAQAKTIAKQIKTGQHSELSQIIRKTEHFLSIHSL